MNSEPSDEIEYVDFDREAETAQVRFDSGSVAPSIAVVFAMSRLYDAEPTELAPLGEFVDPDAVRAICENRRFRRQEGDIKVEFPYLDHLVTVKSYGVVDVEPLTADE